MRIVLDSNFFISHQFDLTAPDFQVLGRGVELGAVSLVVPEVVVGEVERKFRDQLAAEASALSKAEATIQRWTGRAPTAEVDVANLSGKFNARFAEWRNNHNVVVPSTSAVSSETLVARAMQRKKPFRDSSDEGMRDAIIWESLVQLAATDDDDVVLLSQNTRDFAADKEGTALHPDLAAEVKASAAEVKYFTHLRPLREGILDEAIAEAQEDEDLGAAKKFAKALNYVEVFGPRIVEALEDGLAESLPSEFNSASIPHLDPPDEIIVDEAVFGLGERKVELTVRLEFEIHADGFANKSDTYFLSDEPGFNVERFDWNEWSSTMTYVDKASVDVTIVVDASGPGIAGFQIDGVGLGRYPQ